MSAATRQQGFRVLKGGMLSLVQDTGRFGQRHLGLTSGGPLDLDSYRWANRLCRNAQNASALEVSVGGLQLLCQVDTRIAVTGADMALTINGKAVSGWQSHVVYEGDKIVFGYARNGLRAYLSVCGGFQLEPQFGSTATVLREAIGGIEGRALAAGDFLPCLPAQPGPCSRAPRAAQLQLPHTLVCRLIPGYQYLMYKREQRQKFFSSEYLVSPRTDRMGYQLEGASILSPGQSLLSEGICYGAVQLPTDGQPFVLLNDCQTIGGYPKLGAILSLDLWKLAQLGPGSRLRFRPISAVRARRLLFKDKRAFESTAPEPLDESSL